MKTLSCVDMGIANCNYVARADSEKEVIEKAVEHGQTMHASELAGINREDMMSMMKTKIKDAM